MASFALADLSPPSPCDVRQRRELVKRLLKSRSTATIRKTHATLETRKCIAHIRRDTSDNDELSENAKKYPNTDIVPKDAKPWHVAIPSFPTSSSVIYMYVAELHGVYSAAYRGYALA
jgi:hypothetical protein